MARVELNRNVSKSAVGFQPRGLSHLNASPSGNSASARTGDTGKQRNLLTEVVTATDQTIPEANGDAWQLHRQGIRLTAAGELKAACSSLRHAAEADPSEARHRFVLSQIQQQRGDAAAALVEAARATRCPNAEPWHFHHYGVLLAERGILDQAKVSLLTAVRGDPDQWRSRVALVNLLDRLGEVDEAIAVAAVGVEAYRHTPRLLRQYALLLARCGRFDEARSALGSARGSGLSDLKQRLAAEWRYVALRFRAVGDGRTAI